MIVFRMAPHTPMNGDVVEIWSLDANDPLLRVFLGTIYPNGPDGIRINTLRMTGADNVTVDDQSGVLYVILDKLTGERQ